MKHWAEQYIGTEWANDPERDCWGFVRRVWREQFGLDVPAVDVDALNRLSCVRAIESHAPSWQRVEQPQEGDAVLLARGRHPSHVGVWAAGGILHCLESSGTVFQRPSGLALTGWRIAGFYRRAA